MKNMILIVDDEPINLSILANLFKQSFTVRACKSGEEAIHILSAGIKPDIILLDIMMPGIDGYETLGRIKRDPNTSDIPVIFISALDSDIDENHGFELGAVEYITKPFRPGVVRARVLAHIELKQSRDKLKDHNRWLEGEVERRVRENQLIQDASIIALTQLAEARDFTTGNHILRTRRYMEILGRNLLAKKRFEGELDEKKLEHIIKAAPLHDIGKIGIPDTILLKAGKLTADEYTVIKTHCEIGAEALLGAINQSLDINRLLLTEASNDSLTYMKYAETIARYHHERWDGTGYPEGLKGREIPLPARMMALADVFDALTTHRPYKRAWSMQETTQYILDQKGHQFDPKIVRAFEEELEQFEQVLLTLGA